MVARTYNAILNGNRLDWKGEAPKEQGPVDVQVTVIETSNGSSEMRGRAMAQALSALADRRAFALIPDPIEWQRDVRKDRDLPGR
jgi:hypothetical protein